MKHYLLIAALALLVQVAQAQSWRPLPGLPLDSATGLIVYRGSIPLSKLPTAEAYGRAQEWIALQFEQYSSVVQFADPNRGVLIGRAMTLAHGPGQKYQEARQFNLIFRFHFRIEAGTLHYVLTDISYPRYPTTTASADTGNGLAADALVSWIREDSFSQIGSGSTQTHRLPVEPELRYYTQFTDKGAPKPRMIQQCLGIQEAMTTLIASLTRAVSQPFP